MAAEKREFQAETKQLLDLMVNSIYMHKEIFLRELISNASDAIDKLKFNALTNKDILEGQNEDELEIWIKPDKTNNTLSITDNGIGMSYDDVVNNLGTIAKSGTQEFVKALKDAKEGGSLIGRFGVGFYSAFMVAQNVEVHTKAHGSAGVFWRSEADGSYEVEEKEKEGRGTTVTLKLRDDLEQDYLSDMMIESLVKKYSDYIRCPIKMNVIKTEKPKDENGEEIKDAKEETKTVTKTLNSMTPLWERSKDDIKQEEYNSFYTDSFHDWNEPLEVVHTKAEGTVEYTALLFIPSKQPFGLNPQDKGLTLYSRGVFIKDDFKDMLPEYFRFVRGLVDSPDFPLNISREFLQNNREIKTIAKNVEKKIIDALKKIIKDDREKYAGFWKEFGDFIRHGVYSDISAKDKLKELLVFPSSNSEGYTTLKEYVERMPEEQKEIYYATGKSKEFIDRLPQMEAIREKGYEVLYFTEKTDEFITLALNEYENKKLRSISKGDLGLDEEKEEDKEEKKKKEEESKSMLEALKENLKEKVSDVKLSSRLKNSAVCLVNDENGMLSMNMEQVIENSGAKQMLPKAGKVLELNPGHALFGKLKDVYEKEGNSDELKDYSHLLYDQAAMIEGYTVDDPVNFAKKMSELMLKAMQ